ncbi:unnamed protein product [Symbiodinium microadriaticum]|nr:unnamed protein product [Symbiodinium microadriaticum]
MPAAGESTAEEAQTISVDSVTTEEEKKPRNQSTASSSRQRAISLPKTSSQTRSLSSGQGAKASERRPSKSVIQSRPTIKKTKDREPLSSPEQPKSRSSSRSATRRALQDRQASPSPISRRSAALTPPSQTKGEVRSNLFEGDTADAALDGAIRSQKRRLPVNPPVLSLVSQSQSTNQQLSEQLMHAEEKMKIAHQEDIQRHEEIAMSLLAQMNEMVQEDQGSTLRIEELERQRDLLRNAVEHVNRVHQNSLGDHFRGIERIEEASQAQHLRDEELATSLHQELGQLRSDAAQTFANIEQQAQGEGQQLAMQYQRLVDELNQKAHETLQFKSEASQNSYAMAIMKEQMRLMKNEETTMRDEANKKMSALESGAQELQNRLDREEFAKSETMLRLRQMEMPSGNDGGVSPSALHSEVGELRRRLRQQGMLKPNSQSERTRSAALSYKIYSGMRTQNKRKIMIDGQGLTGCVEIGNIGSIQLSIYNRNIIMVTIMAKVKKKKKKKLHPQITNQPGTKRTWWWTKWTWWWTKWGFEGIAVAVGEDEVILRNRRPKMLQTLQKSKYPEGKPTRLSFLRSQG